MAVMSNNNIERVMLDAMNRLIEEAIQEEADKAAERVRKIILEKTAAVSLEVLKRIDMEWIGGNFTITIRDQMKGQPR